jgi:superfamily II DNA/RNA helicase
MPAPIKKLADKFLTDPKQIEVARPASANVNIDQKLVIVPTAKKRDAVRDILREDGFKNAIIFCNKKTTVRELYTSLKRSGFAVGQIQGDMDQSNRIAEFDRFKKDEITILVASDVAARGLDVKGVSHVINFDVPWQPDDYVHRIGRTGRAGMKGIAYTLATSADAEAVGAIEKLTGHKIARVSSADGAGKEQPTVTSTAPPANAEKPEKAERRPRREEPKRKAEAPKKERVPELVDEGDDYRPTVEPRTADDAEPAWNGPVPSFLSFGAS